MINRASQTFIVGIITLSMTGAVQPPEPAQFVLHNGQIWTGDIERPNATAVVIDQGRIVFVGNDRQAVDFIGEATTVYDALGRRVLPGLIDTHIHLAGAADDFQFLYLREARSREHLLEMIADYASGLDAEQWLVGVRWTAESWLDQRPPDADEIAEAAGGRRAVLIRMDGHMLLASRAALEYADITEQGPEAPAGGRIGRSEAGLPDGAIYEQAMGLIPWRAAVLRENDDVLERFRLALRECNRVGLTQVGAIEHQSTIEQLLVPLDQRNELTLRIAATVRPTSDRPGHWRRMFEWAASNRHPSPRVRVTGFKGMMDGTLGSRTAWQNEPYLDNPDDPTNAGFPLALAGSGALGQHILTGAGMNLQPAVHAIGERANHVLLNWFEDLSAEQRKVLRPRIEHAQHLLPEDVERFARLNVVASMQPLHKADDGRYAEQRLGIRRLRTSYAYRDLIDSGATVAFGSDWPVVSANPWLGIAAAVTSKTLDGRIFLPEQAITVEEALVAYTRAAAQCLLSDDETGMIREGFAGDLVVLDRDVLAINPMEIAETQVLLTVVVGLWYINRDRLICLRFSISKLKSDRAFQNGQCVCANDAKGRCRNLAGWFMKNAPIKVLCVDDNDLVAEGIRMKLNMTDRFQWLGQLRSAEELVQTVLHTRPHVVLLDIDMPGKDVFVAMQELSELFPNVRVVMLSGYVQQRLIDRAIESGAWGYVSKSDGADTVLNAITRVVEGEFTLGPDVEDEYRRQ